MYVLTHSSYVHCSLLVMATATPSLVARYQYTVCLKLYIYINLQLTVGVILEKGGIYSKTEQLR